jgi:hypothetical protein
MKATIKLESVCLDPPLSIIFGTVIHSQTGTLTDDAVRTFTRGVATFVYVYVLDDVEAPVFLRYPVGNLIYPSGGKRQALSPFIPYCPCTVFA